MSSFKLVTIGFMLVLAGFLVPFLMVLGVLEPGFVLSFSAYFSSLVGLLLTLYGISHHVSWRRRDGK
jgi:hypothetical protein